MPSSLGELSTVAGAQQLGHDIRAYWKALGFEPPEVWIEDIAPNKDGKALRSDMVNGMPQRRVK